MLDMSLGFHSSAGDVVLRKRELTTNLNPKPLVFELLLDGKFIANFTASSLLELITYHTPIDDSPN